MSTDNNQCPVLLTVAQKYEIIDCHDKDPNALQKERIARFRIPQSTLSKIINEKIKIRNDHFGARSDLDQKKEKRSKLEQNEPFLGWFTWARNGSANVVGVTLWAKANDLLRAAGAADEVSEGWIPRWKQKHSITSAKKSWGSARVDMGFVNLKMDYRKVLDLKKLLGLEAGERNFQFTIYDAIRSV